MMKTSKLLTSLGDIVACPVLRLLKSLVCILDRLGLTEKESKTSSLNTCKKLCFLTSLSTAGGKYVAN